LVRRRCRTILGALLVLAGLLVSPLHAAAASGSLELRPGRQNTAPLGGSLTDVIGSAQFTVPAQRPVWLALQFRADSVQDGYRTRVRLLENGTVWVGFSRVVSGAETILSSQRTETRVRTGDQLNVEGLVQGANPVTLAVRAWVEGQRKPGWQQTRIDRAGSRITDGGPVLVWGYLSSSADGGADIAFRNGSAAAPAPTEPANPPTGGAKPSAATTGVPAGYPLVRHDGDITVTKDGTVLNGLDVHGFVTVRADNVKITNSIVRGGRAKGFATGLITNYGNPGLVIEDVDLRAEFPSVYFDGIKGNNFTARRVHVVGNVDSIKIHGDNVKVEDSLLENTTYYASDPHQDGGETHNDNIQILQGRNLMISGNTIRGATNFAILGGAEQNNVSVVIDGNWLDGGHCTLKLQIRNGWSETAVVTGNRFGPRRKVASCPFTAYPAVNLTSSGNVFEETGSPVPVLRVVS
jgi:hypothetical protein